MYEMKLHYQENSLKSGIYRILNIHNNRVYIGQSKEFKARWNGHRYSLLNKKHQNKFLQADFNKCRELLGNDDFLEFHVMEVMEGSTKEERGKKEEELIATVFDHGKQCYNLTPRAVSREGCPSKTPEATREKIRISAQKRMADPATRQKMRLLHLGKPKSPEAVEKQRQTMLGRMLSAEHKAKLSQAHLGKKLSSEHIEKLRAKSKGRKFGPMSEGVKEKHRLAHFGKTHTQETKEALSKRHKGKQFTVLTDESKKKIGEWSKCAWQDPAMRKKIMNSRKHMYKNRKPHSEETKQKIAEKAKERWAKKKLQNHQ